MQSCIAIATQASLKEMIAPGVLVLVSPILVGTLCGVEAVAGMLAGAIASSVQLAISMSNTGGAWDNAKKYTEVRNPSISTNPPCHTRSCIILCPCLAAYISTGHATFSGCVISLTSFLCVPCVLQKGELNGWFAFRDGSKMDRAEFHKQAELYNGNGYVPNACIYAHTCMHVRKIC